MATCKDCLHFDVCDALEDGNVLPKIDPLLCGCFKVKDKFVEVVRCKDCKFWDDDERCNGIKNGLIFDYTNGYDYCSYGERKDGAEE